MPDSAATYFVATYFHSSATGVGWGVVGRGRYSRQEVVMARGSPSLTLTLTLTLPLTLTLTLTLTRCLSCGRRWWTWSRSLCGTTT